ncbi:hypothetical protein ACT3UJ_06620 [Halomonas sp. 86]|uniref:hypothetical protein n=1 Tax=unclassified Halomonas TaxID=2609666 RepID=UPI0040348C09
MRKNQWLAMAVVTGLIMAGCSKNTVQQAIKDQERMERHMAAQEAKRAQRQIQAGNEQLDALPAWIINKPRPDGTGMFGVGIGESRDLTNAIRKSNLQARYDVAKEIENVLTAEETATGSADSQYRYIVNSFVNQVDLAGLEDVMRDVQSGPRGFRVYTLVKLPYDDFNQALQGFGQGDQLESAYQRLMERAASDPGAPADQNVQRAQAHPQGEDRLP